MGTVDVARDLDVLRAVLGDDQLNYLGKSYGTLIGSLYAEQFPDRVGRMVLDGVVDPTQTRDGGRARAGGRASSRRCGRSSRTASIYTDDAACPLIGDIDDGRGPDRRRSSTRSTPSRSSPRAGAS